MHKISESWKFGQIGPLITELAALERLKNKFPILLAHSFLIEPSSKLLVTRTGIKARTSSISGLWFPWPIYMFFEMKGCQVRLVDDRMIYFFQYLFDWPSLM